MIMQTMTDSSCVHRVAVDAFAPTPIVLATLIFPPLNVVCFCAQAFIQIIRTTARTWPLQDAGSADWK
jgi:hypothetical protein